jgi:hypothetical protein
MALIGDRYGGSVSGRVQWFSHQGHTPPNRSLSCAFIGLNTCYWTTRERAHRYARGYQSRYRYLLFWLIGCCLVNLRPCVHLGVFFILFAQIL